MIGNDHVYPVTARVLHYRMSANTTIDADDQLVAVFPSLIDRRFAHPIAVYKPLRYVVAYSNADYLKRLFQDHGRSSAVYIVIAIDEDLLSRFACPVDPIHSQAHIPHQERRIEIVDRWVDEL